MTVENFILGLDGQQKAIVSFLHQRLTNQHDLIPKIRFKIPMYYRKSWVCYLNPIKNDGIELAFLCGKSLSNEQGLLNCKGRKMVCGIDLFNVCDIPEKSIDEIVQEALILDELVKTKR
ncbi:DUF1801 domain-containing protein [Ekhidna sp.]|jgi:hypothetical protein|uniref:DUF1801 domain-containing protein n=1 Tax=Ekhidna sp. TaxID=2608089 RepID=UPI0032EB19DE